MEASIKERLTGALIFVAAVVVIVPEMVSGPSPESAAPLAAQSAEDGPPVRTFSMTLNDQAEPRAIAINAAAPAPAPAPEPQPPAAAQPEAAAQLPGVARGEVTLAKPPATQAVIPDVGQWWLRVGIFGVRGNAERLAKRLGTAGFAVNMDTQVVGGKDMYRVRVGPVRDRDAALALQARLKALGDESLLLPP